MAVEPPLKGRIEKGFKPPDEVLRYFSEKQLRPRFSWLDVWGEEHAHAFTVAKAVELDVVEAFKKTIQQALRDGHSIETWKANLKPELQKLGWWGQRTVTDPANSLNKQVVDFSSPRRLKTIFWSNMRAARAAGQWQRIQRSKRSLPYLIYVRTTSADPRPEHRQWWGIILPVDHPFWRSHFPPNGWGCKCAVRAATSREAESYRGQEGYRFDAPTIETEKFVNRRTGEVTYVPKGIDPGWHTNPGLARARTFTTALQQKLEEAGPKLARASITRMWQDAVDMRHVMGLPERIAMPVAVAEAAQASLDAKSPVVVVYNDGLRKKTAPPDLRDPARFALTQSIMDVGEMVDEGEPGARTYFATIASRLWELVVFRSRAGYLRIRTLHHANARDIAHARKKQAARNEAETRSKQAADKT